MTEIASWHTGLRVYPQQLPTPGQNPIHIIFVMSGTLMSADNISHNFF